MDGKGTQGTAASFAGMLGVGSRLGSSREEATHRTTWPWPAPKVSRARRSGPPSPERPRRPRPSRGGGGGRLGINSAGGKVRPPPAHSSPSPAIMPARLSSPRALAGR